MMPRKQRPTDGRRPASISGTLRQIPGRIWLVLFGMFINRLGNFLQIFLVLYLTFKGFSASAAAIALGAYGVGSIIGVLLGGSISDRIGYAWTIVSSMAIAALLTVSLVHVTSLTMVYPVAAAIGLAAQAYRPASAAMLVESTPADQHVMVFAIYRMAFNLGTTVGPLLGALLITYSYDLIFYAEAAAQASFALCAYFALIHIRRPATPPQAGSQDATDQEPQARGAYLAVLRDRKYVLFMLALFLNAVVYIQHTSVLPLQIRADGHSTTFYAALLSMNALMVIGLELLLTKYVQLLPARLAVAIGVGLVGVGMNLYIAGPSMAMFVIATVVWTLGEIIGTPTASAHPGKVAPPHLRGRYIAAAAFPMQIGYAAGPVIGVTVWNTWQAGVWWMCGLLTVVAVIAAVVGMTAPKRLPESPEEEERRTTGAVADLA